ncbi:MAG: hypothetical protein O7C75_04240 [Verrucomicrobia bacterium]|nr:hypothetical protein [Verrucomicrobiota bacterium]
MKRSITSIKEASEAITLDFDTTDDPMDLFVAKASVGFTEDTDNLFNSMTLFLHG